MVNIKYIMAAYNWNKMQDALPINEKDKKLYIYKITNYNVYSKISKSVQIKVYLFYPFRYNKYLMLKL
jgi:hypothetical protein